jgi:CheY-like chemotaxis protein
LRFSVEDTGIGIATKDLGLIFEPFKQFANGSLSQDGTGLGLAISRQQVELLAGRLDVSSDLGAGSTFSFEIPVAISGGDEVDTGSSQVTGIAPGQTAADGRPFRLLVAEDVEANRQFLVKMLKSFDFEVNEASTGEQALEIWETWQPHLIFMDMRMPALNGLEATRRIKATEQGEKTVVIMLTASAFGEDRSASLAQGCDDFIHKPVRESQIIESLQKHLGVQFAYAQEQTEGPPHLPAGLSLASVQPPDLTEEWKESMRRAALDADVAKMQVLIQEIETVYPDFSRILAEKVYHFDYDSIRALLGS